ncbi:hypothetical protein PUN28_013239 [Cardiocondyla obscurior]|uniref:nicotinamidase n=1 Tax=Cardiocondyla obscurior TaxID=286306 RepID=A0AAW2F7C4_9HYME
MARPVNGDPSLFSDAILSKFDVQTKGIFNYEKFRMFCVQVFGTDEVERHEWRVREIFKLFDANADGILNDQELYRCCNWIRAVTNPVHVLLIVDVQNDFIDGTLALRKCGYGQEGLEIIEPINRLLRDGRWDKVIYSQDWHPENHISFFDNLAMRELHPESKITKETAKPFDTVVFSKPYLKQILWPTHCVMNTWGAELHKDLLILPSSERVRKGQHPDKESYSVFEKDADGSSELEKILLAIGGTHLYVCGVAYDVCVKTTCLDGLQMGYQLAVIDDCCRGVKPDDVTATKKLIIETGGLVACSNRILSLINEGKRSLEMAHHAAKVISR